MRAYLDHNATSTLDPRVKARWEEWRELALGNPSSTHSSGRRARALIDSAREQVAAALGVGEDEILFTSGGTESINLALLGAWRHRGSGTWKLAVGRTEHSAVLECARALERQGCALSWIEVDSLGSPALELDFEGLSKLNLVSFPWANGEIGSVWRVPEMCARLRSFGTRPLVFSDAVQALGRIPLDLSSSGVDLAAFSTHKVGGPLGVGILYARRGTQLEPLIHGGGQEAGLRSGTEDAARIAAAGLSVELATRERTENCARWEKQTRWLLQELERRGLAIAINGPGLDQERRLMNTLNLALASGDGKVLVTRLDLEGLEVSSGSACASGSIEPSHVLRALGQDDAAARRGLRVSLGPHTSQAELEHAAASLVRVLTKR